MTEAPLMKKIEVKILKRPSRRFFEINDKMQKAFKTQRRNRSGIVD